MFRILAIGDVVGRPGRAVLAHFLPRLREERGVDFVVANAENAASGSGITEKIYAEIRGYGADVISMGDHAYKRRESLPLFDRSLQPGRKDRQPVLLEEHKGVEYAGPCLAQERFGTVSMDDIDLLLLQRFL